MVLLGVLCKAYGMISKGHKHCYVPLISKACGDFFLAKYSYIKNGAFLDCSKIVGHLGVKRLGLFEICPR
jgi:hypothetical protein